MTTYYMARTKKNNAGVKKINTVKKIKKMISLGGVKTEEFALELESILLNASLKNTTIPRFQMVFEPDPDGGDEPRYITFENTNLEGARLSDFGSRESPFYVQFMNVNVENAVLDQAVIDGTIDETNLRHTSFIDGNFNDMMFGHCEAQMANLTRTVWSGINSFDNCDFTDAVFVGMSLEGVLMIFTNCNLTSANFSGAKLIHNQLQFKTVFIGSDLTGANFTNANLTGCEFSSCNLNGTIFDGANITSAFFDEDSLASIPARNWSEAEGSTCDPKYDVITHDDLETGVNLIISKPKDRHGNHLADNRCYNRTSMNSWFDRKRHLIDPATNTQFTTKFFLDNGGFGPLGEGQEGVLRPEDNDDDDDDDDDMNDGGAGKHIKRKRKINKTQRRRRRRTRK